VSPFQRSCREEICCRADELKLAIKWLSGNPRLRQDELMIRVHYAEKVSARDIGGKE